MKTEREIKDGLITAQSFLEEDARQLNKAIFSKRYSEALEYNERINHDLLAIITAIEILA